MTPNSIKTAAYLSAALGLGIASSSAAAILYDTVGSTYSQNFNSLPLNANAGAFSSPWTNGETLTGFHGTLDPARSSSIATSDGTASTVVSDVGTLTSMGPANNTDRAFGIQPGIGQTLRVAGQFQNTTGFTLNQFSLGFTAEQWRRINEASLNVVFDYQVFTSGAGSLDATTGWTSVSALGFTSPSTGGSGGRDGNDSANQVEIAPVAVPLTWNNTDELWIRWSGTSPSGDNRRQMVGIDDLSFTAVVPEPSAALLGVIGALTLLRRRR